MTAHYSDKHADEQDKQLPLNRSFNNYLIKVCDNSECVEFNFVFAESGATNTQSKTVLTANPVPAEIGKVKLWYNPNYSRLAGLQLYERDGTLVYESAD